MERDRLIRSKTYLKTSKDALNKVQSFPVSEFSKETPPATVATPQKPSKKKKQETPAMIRYTLRSFMIMKAYQPYEDDYEWIYDEYAEFCGENGYSCEYICDGFMDHYAEFEGTVEMNEKTHEDTQRDYLRERLRTISYDKQHALRKNFGLISISPEDGEELVAWVKAGNYRLKECTLCSGDKPKMELFWGKDEPDHKGFAAACDKLRKAMQQVSDSIAILSPVEALKAVQDFETATLV